MTLNFPTGEMPSFALEIEDVTFSFGLLPTHIVEQNSQNF